MLRVQNMISILSRTEDDYIHAIVKTLSHDYAVTCI